MGFQRILVVETFCTYMIRKHYFLLLAFACILTLNSCQKEELQESKLTLFAESMGNTKVAVEGRFSHWVSGETVRINNATKAITVSDGVATVDNTTNAVSAPFHAVYPASLCPETDLASVGSVTVTLPDTYQYRKSSDLQQLDMPMAASNAEGEDLSFKHLTGALAVKITNDFGGTMSIDEVIVESSVSQISGSCEVDFLNVTNQTANDEGVSEAQRRVRMLFESTALNIADGATEVVILPVMPVSNSNKFTVTVNATYGGKSYSFSRTQGTGGRLARNELGYVPVTMSATNEHVGLLIKTAGQYNELVSQLNTMTTGTSTVRVTIDGTIDFGGATVTPINLNSNHVIFNGIHNAKLTNLTFGGVSNCYGMTYSFYPASLIEVNNLTIENATMPGNNETQCYIGTFCACTKGDVTLNNCTAKNITIGQASHVLKAHIGAMIGYVYTNNANNRPPEVNLEGCGLIQDNVLLAENATMSEPTIGGMIGLLQEGYSIAINTLIKNCSVMNSTGENFSLTISSPSSNQLRMGSLVGNYAMCSSSYDYSNLHILNNCCKINYIINRSNSDRILVGGIIGSVTSTNYPSTTYWNGNSVLGNIKYVSGGPTDNINVKKVIGSIDDGNNWNGRVDVSNLTISTL